MHYQIVGLCPVKDHLLGGWGFGIKLFPEFKECVKKSKINSDQSFKAVEQMGRIWLDSCGYGRKMSFNGKERYLYEVNMDLRVSWGDWGPEHITVPGDACGLDISDSIMGPTNGKYLSPHNVDTMNQAMLLLIVFTWFAESIYILSR